MHAVLSLLSRLRKPALDLAERVGTTWVQTFAATLVVAGALDLDAVSAAAIAGLTAAINLVYRLSTSWLPTVANPWLELAERVVVTAVSAFLGALLASGHYGLSDLRAAGLAGVAAALVAVKAGLAKLLGSSTASLLTVGKHEAPTA